MSSTVATGPAEAGHHVPVRLKAGHYAPLTATADERRNARRVSIRELYVRKRFILGFDSARGSHEQV